MVVSNGIVNVGVDGDAGVRGVLPSEKAYIVGCLKRS